MPPSKSPQKSLKIVLLLILLIGAILRLHAISYQSLWNDELATWDISNKSDIKTVIQYVGTYDTHPPGYYVLMFYVQKFLGDSELYLRLPSAVAGIVAIYLIYLVGAELYSYKEGLLAAALLASSVEAIHYSQEARSNSMLMCIGLFSIYIGLLLLRSLRTNKTPPWYLAVGYIVTAASLCYLHYFGILLVSLEAIWLGVLSFSNKRTFLYTCILFFSICMLYSPWIFHLIALMQRGSIWIPPPKPKAIYDFLVFVFNESPSYLYYFISPIVFIFLIKKIVGFIKQKSSQSYAAFFSSPGFFLFMWFALPFTIAYTKSLVSAPILINRNLIISLPAAYLLVAMMILSLPLKSVLKIIPACICTLYPVYVLMYQFNYYLVINKEQFREVASFLVDFESMQLQLSNIPVISYANSKSYFDHYFQKKGSEKRVSLNIGKKEHIPQLYKFIDGNNINVFWYVYSHKQPDKEFLNYLENNFSPFEYKKFVGARALLFIKYN